MEILTMNGVTVVVMPKRFDTAAAPEVESALKKIISNREKKIICDFSGTEYINSPGLKVLLSATKAIMREGGRIILCSLRPSVTQVFEIAGFTQIFSIFSSRDDALRAQ
jgi:anti-anti-sigma factor